MSYIWQLSPTILYPRPHQIPMEPGSIILSPGDAKWLAEFLQWQLIQWRGIEPSKEPISKLSRTFNIQYGEHLLSVLKGNQ